MNFTHPAERPFSLVDLSISFPFVPESISILTLFFVALAAPAIIMALICLLWVPGTAGGRTLSAPHAIRRKMWELYAAITGIALSVAIAFFITQGVKIIFGKPRPHLLAVCNPDLSNIKPHIVGNYAGSIDIRWTLVNSSICQTANSKELKDSFQSFPSGHCSFSWSGLLYFSLFLAAKFSWSIPHLPLQRIASNRPETPLLGDRDTLPLLPMHQPAASSSVTKTPESAPQIANMEPMPSNPISNQGAAPPAYGIIILLIPLAVATYIASTRYSEYWHDGFDCISGSLIGIGSAIFAFRWYHLPITRGQGWAWGPRSSGRAFGIGLGVGSYVGPEGWQARGVTAQND